MSLEQSASVQYRQLKSNFASDDYQLYRAALEWSLIEPIVIESREDVRSERSWKEKVTPYNHQVTNLITYCRRLPVTLLADDVGLGKTVSAGLIASELIARHRISRILVVCPKLLIPQWKEELETKFGIPGIGVAGRQVRETKPANGKGAVITTYHSARLHLDAIAKNGFEMLVLDEAHKLRNLYGTEAPPAVAKRFRQALVERTFKYVLMLTATPIQNRLWDLYSLVDILAAARGHENPFGSESSFERRFIEDGRSNARRLRSDKREEFRSIVYSYMSRFRRMDAKLYFPERETQLHRVNPTEQELNLIKALAIPIQKLNALSQVSLLKAVVSSPQALLSQMETMARNGTIPPELKDEVKKIVSEIGVTAKLKGLSALIDQLRKERPEDWRVVVFTELRTTQAVIEAFLSDKGIKCGLINGDSGNRNQETIKGFWSTPPEVHVVLSTEAGSEGVNLQKANVLINYDLPWNPMRVEQRIGRIQRLASEHAKVCIFNVVLKGTFEERIVGRLMEKLQMASHAIGDVEALLEAAGVDEEKDSFEQRIRQLVIDSLAGKDVEAATRLAESSIVDAKKTLTEEERNIESLLGGMDGANNSGPRCPRLPPQPKSIDVKTFVERGLKKIGGRLSEDSTGLLRCELDDDVQLICFDENELKKFISATLYAPGTSPFERLTARLTADGMHQIRDLDDEPSSKGIQLAKQWVSSFGGSPHGIQIVGASHEFDGKALMRVRVSVAHDSYERLLEEEIQSPAADQFSKGNMERVNGTIDPGELRIPKGMLIEKGLSDRCISDFCRFYQERLGEEIKAAGQDSYKRKKLEEDFTPRTQIEVAGLEGSVSRQIRCAIQYTLGSNDIYESVVDVRPCKGEIISAPSLETCQVSGKIVPADCLESCAISGTRSLRHLLLQSEMSGRWALKEHTAICGLTKKRMILDEVETSAATGRTVSKSLMKTSAISGKRVEPEFIEKCQFTDCDALKSELSTSEISGKRFRTDEAISSAVSGKIGHKSEFIKCVETKSPLLKEEAEQCEVSKKLVMPGILETCEETGKKVLPSELDRCAATGKKALRKLFVVSSLSNAHLLEREAVRSITGKYCSKTETKVCAWSDKQRHPDDLFTCALTGLLFSVDFQNSKSDICLDVLRNLLNGTNRKQDFPEVWDAVSKAVSTRLNAKCRIEGAQSSSDGHCLAVVVEVKTWLGMKVRYAGFLYSLEDKQIIGHVALGKREKGIWTLEEIR